MKKRILFRRLYLAEAKQQVIETLVQVHFSVQAVTPIFSDMINSINLRLQETPK